MVFILINHLFASTIISFAELPSEWRGLQCESYLYFQQREIQMINEYSTALYNTRDTYEYFEWLHFLNTQIKNLSTSYLNSSHLELSIDISELTEDLTPRDFIATTTYTSGIVFLSPFGTNELNDVRLKEGILSLKINALDLCNSSPKIIQVNKDCDIDLPKEEICLDSSICLTNYNGFHPNLCKDAIEIELNFLPIFNKLNIVNRNENTGY